MGKEIRIEFEHAFYHVISRGNTRSKIFKNDIDKLKFLEYLQKLNNKFEVKIHAYCLMRNHYHLLLETPRGNLSKVMHKLNTSYTNYYNYSNNRSGHLFSGRYKAILVEKDRYAQVLSAYIHLNPVRAKLEDRPGKYEWDSFKYYSGENMNLPEFMSTELILGYFDNDKSIAQQKYIEYINEQADLRKDPFKKLKAGVILGSEPYMKWLRENIKYDKRIDVKISFSKEQRKARLTEKKIRNIISMETGLNDNFKKKILIYLLRENTPLSLKQIGKKFGIKESAVNMIVKRFLDKVDKNKELKDKVDILIEKIKVCNV